MPAHKIISKKTRWLKMTRYAQFFYVSLNGFNKLNPPRQITWQSDFREINEELVGHGEKLIGSLHNDSFGRSVSLGLGAHWRDIPRTKNS